MKMIVFKAKPLNMCPIFHQLWKSFLYYGSFNNYVDPILANFDPLLPSSVKIVVNLPGIVWTAIANKWIVMKRPGAVICAIIAEGGIT